MKNIVLKITGLTLALFVAIGINSCVKDDFDQPPVLEVPVGEQVAVSEIAALAMTSATPIKITEDRSMFGLVSMGEQSGNFYKQVVFEDVTGGIMLEFLGSTSLNVGDSIQVNLKGARVYNYNNLPQIDSLDITKNVLKISAGNDFSPVEVSIPELKTFSYTGRVVKLNEVQFTNSELGKTFADADALVTENRNLEDCDENTVLVRTSGYANFAGEPIPEGNGSLIAFVGRYRDDVQLNIRSYNEIIMNAERCGNGGGGGGGAVDPVDVVDEDFQSLSEYDEITLSGWTSLSVAGDRNWIAQTFDNEVYIQASGYNSGLAEMETWIITPPVTNISQKVLSFKSAKAYWTHNTSTPLTVLISTDFVGDNFETATWTELSVNIANENSSDHAWIESGEIDLSAYSGNAAVAFKYVGSDTESTSIRIDNVLIDVSGGGGGGGGGGSVDPVDEINEDFQSLNAYDEITFEGWTSLHVSGDRNWIAQTFDAEVYVQASGYNSGSSEMETWLITPPVTNIEDKALSFKSAMAYWAHGSNAPCAVMVSTDFVGDNFETATWTEIDVTLAQESDGDHTWVESGEYDLSAFSGNAAIAFRYIGSDTESTSFRVDDIVVTDGSGGGGGGGGGTVDFINEDFSSQTNYEDIALEGWVNVSVEGDRKWQGKTYQDEIYAQATGYNSGLAAMETWLITPKITDIGSKSLSIKTAMAYWAHGTDSPLTVYVSEDYDGENYETATWVEISVPMANQNSGDHTWVDSGLVDLSNFDGDAAIAFKYVGSATLSTSFRLDDILVQ